MNQYFFPKLTAVEALEPYRLSTTWTTGETLIVDVESRIRKHQALSSILDPVVFKTVHIAEWGGSIEWIDSEFGEDNVYAWAKEQAGEPSHEMLDAWMRNHNLSLTTASEVLGMSRRMVSYYRTAQKPIPRHVWLACIGWECQQKHNIKHRKKAA
ncbi:MAG: DUF2442 domain-containing protein [Candidatus Riflebacteria bacterium]|nr:DUF2442 domain-containing protein [Candidatus Riflebacteria bacterium]